MMVAGSTLTTIAAPHFLQAVALELQRLLQEGQRVAAMTTSERRELREASFRLDRRSKRNAKL
jgi:hypothetical protein